MGRGQIAREARPNRAWGSSAPVPDPSLVPGQNLLGSSQTVSSRLAPWMLGMMMVSLGMS